jgi:oligopeptide transport system substrate-binding protein
MRRVAALVGTLAIAVSAFALTAIRLPADVAALDRNEVRILAAQPSTLDPAKGGDVDTAAVTAQLYETLTTYDAALVLQPALAASWEVAADGLSATFHLRPNLTFSDGSPLTAEDVVGSWLRIIDPASPAPLVDLILDVRGARDHVLGRQSDPALVGLRANGNDVEVTLERPGADFPAIVSSPLFGVVPASVWKDGTAIGPGMAVSGGYAVASVSDTETVLERNERYWAGAPQIRTVHLVHDLGGRSPIAEFSAGNLDYTGVSAIDSPWIPYDHDLGPQLRQTPQLSLTYLGINTRAQPFDDVRVRQAVGAAVDWERIVTLGGVGGEVLARSMVPAGIPGAGNRDWLPVHDPARARSLLADAGYPGGSGLPTIRFAAGSLPIADGIAADLLRELGMHVEIETLEDHSARISEDPPNMWANGWIADYIGPNDFLGVLLGSDSSNNDSGWASPVFDQAIADALSTRDAATSLTAFERALAEIQREVPMIPLYVGTAWALSRDGLLGAGDNGLGIQRMAGMAWAP